MAQNIFKLVLTDEAQDFIDGLPEAVSYKIFYNIKRVAGGERNKELFKKLGRTLRYGSSVRYITRPLTVCLPFGTETRKPW